jgi:SAM-dependent methyltransferase
LSATPARFTADWLALREDFDRQARDTAEPPLDLRAFARRLCPNDEPLQVLDLACGSGANLRYLAPRLGGRQRWTLVDRDTDLLAAVPAALGHWAAVRGFFFEQRAGTLRIAGPGWRADIETRRVDLAHSLDACPLASAALVTASALLDLVSGAWIEQLLVRAGAAGAALLFALSVDGRHDWQPALPGDSEVARLFAAHQSRDKGFGPALGPLAATFTAERLAAGGWHCVRSQADWRIDADEGASDIDMLRTMIEGIAAAAFEQAPRERDSIQAWKQLRIASSAHGRLVVGHQDLFATPPKAASHTPSIR